MKARVIPWSSVVGTGLLLTDESGLVVGQMALHNVRGCTDENRRAIMTNMAQLVADAINREPDTQGDEVEKHRRTGAAGEPGVQKMT